MELEIEQQDINSLTRSLFLLQGCSIKTNDEEYNLIIESIKNYIEKHCIHNVVYDLFDSTPFHSYSVKYCTKCEKQFPFSDGNDELNKRMNSKIEKMESKE